MNKGFISLGFPLEWYDLIFMRSKIKKIFQEVDYDLIMDIAQRLKVMDAKLFRRISCWR